MNQENLEHQITAYLHGELSETERTEFEQYLKSSEPCQNELLQMRKIESVFASEKDEVPSQTLKQIFHANLSKSIAKEHVSDKKLLTFPTVAPKKKVKYLTQCIVAAALLLIGFSLSSFLEVNHLQKRDEEITELRNQMSNMKQMQLAQISILPRPSQRIKALISYTPEDSMSPQAIDLLIDILKEDQNVNVRYAALQVLTDDANNPDMRELLLPLITHQEEPLILFSIIQLCITSNDRRIVPSLKTLVWSDKTDDHLKAYAMEALFRFESEKQSSTIQTEML